MALWFLRLGGMRLCSLSAAGKTLNFFGCGGLAQYSTSLVFT
jgi:hypothetical protein